MTEMIYLMKELGVSDSTIIETMTKVNDISSGTNRSTAKPYQLLGNGNN